MQDDNTEQTESVEPAITETPKKRITQVIKERIIMLSSNGLNAKAIAKTVGFSEAAVTAAIKVGK